MGNCTDVAVESCTDMAIENCKVLAFPQGSMGRERPSERVLRKCELSNAAMPDPGSNKGGSLPSTSDFLDRHGEAGNMAVTD